MHSKFLSQLTANEYKKLIDELYNIQNGICFICGNQIDIDIQETNIDHIIPLANKGKDEKGNFALTHASCNKAKQDADLNVARSLHKLKQIQEEVQKKENRAASLKDLLLHAQGSKFKFHYKIENNEIVYSFNELNDITIYKTPIFMV